MVNVNCTQENPPKNRIVLIKGVPLKSAIHNLIPRHDVHSCAIPIPIQIVLHWVDPPADDCFSPQILLPLLSRSFHLDDFFFAAEDQDSRFNWNFHFAQLQKISDLTFWIHNQGIMTKYGGDILVQFFATFCKHTIPREEWMDWINFFCCNLAKRWCFAEEANIKYIFPIYDKNALKGDPRKLCPLISPLSFLNKIGMPFFKHPACVHYI